ncbi:MAG: ABC transporter substrate-binding protein [Jatrophihabitans sp.]|uniref:ABC transporter substrate-binding protein n=1 Tax=Jatrophihabitans sp. TaxID=1932789 RepID=UPI00391428DF
MAVVAAVTLAACGAGKKNNNNNKSSGAAASGASSNAATGGKPITIGTTDTVTALDPAGSYDFGSLTVETNIYQFLMNVPAGGTKPEPDAAKSCAFDTPTTYKCVLQPNLKFSNGDPLTAADVAFTFKRIVTINDPNGPASLIANMKSVAAQGTDTVVFTLNNPNDQTWPFVLGTSAGPIVDSKVFPPNKLLADDKVIGSGPYVISSYQKNQLVQFKASPTYTGPNKPKTSQVTMKYYTTSDNMKLDVQSGGIDVAYRTMSPTDIDSLKKDSNVKVLTGAGGELRYIVFNLKTMPGKTDAEKLAIRKAIAYSIDRQDLSTNVYKGTYRPAYSMVPQGIPFATEPFKSVFGAAPDKAKAASALKAAGISTPVSLHIDYVSDGHYGTTSGDEYNQIKRQLEGTGLFKVTLQGTAYTTYRDQRVKDIYPIYQLGWFPDFVDPDNYLFNFLNKDNFVHAHYCDNQTTAPCVKDGVLPLLTQEETQTGDARAQAFTTIQQKLATETVPYIPLLSGNQVAATSKKITGVQETLDATYQFRMWLLSKS